MAHRFLGYVLVLLQRCTRIYVQQYCTVFFASAIETLIVVACHVLFVTTVWILENELGESVDIILIMLISSHVLVVLYQVLLIRHATNCCYQHSSSSRVRATCPLAYNFFGRARTLLRLVYIYRGKARKKKEKNTPTTPAAGQLAPPHYGRYRALLTFLELLMWASSGATTATDRYPNGRASSVSFLRVAAAL